MPDYFFHVSVELMPGFADHTAAPQPLAASHFFEALRPFARASTQRTFRDTSFDRNREHRREELHSPQVTKQSPVSQSHRSSPITDHRLDHIRIEGADMEVSPKRQSPQEKETMIGRGIGSALSTHYMKGHFQPNHPSEPFSSVPTNEPAFGIVHLYRDADETPGLYKPSPLHNSDLWSDAPTRKPVGKPHPAPKDEECTSLCILAVPSYMTPADFLAFVGKETRNEVTHFRMVRTERANRYMVLMKFRNGKRAREWQFEWNGKVFNPMEPETCHVVFLKSVELVQTPSPPATVNVSIQDEKDSSTSYPRMTNDPFIPTGTGKPLPPRTPSLVELPTCPVCLERMDETTGLLTIPCQHVFHCTCLQKWSGGGCPVCRYTHDDFSSRLGGSHKHKKKIQGPNGEYEVYEEELECETCHADVSLWQCLICGKVGCGRYEGKHAYKHFEDTGHAFSMDLESKRVWDYVGDSYVHRIIQDAGSTGEKLLELPGRDVGGVLDGRDEEEKEAMKMDNLAVEYTHLLTSQLESQRVYFEGMLERAVDKASESTKKAEWLEGEMSALKERLKKLEVENDFVVKGKVDELERENGRLTQRGKKLEEMAKNVNTNYLEEKASAKGLMERVQHLEGTQLQGLKDKIRALEEDNATKDLLMEGLREEHRDAMVQVSAERQLQEMVHRGEIDNEELEGAEVTIGKKPLTARERLKDRLDTEKVLRASRKGLEKKEEISPNVEQPTSLQELLTAMMDVNNLQQGQAWNTQKAKDILDEMKSRMLEQGLLKATETTEGVEDQADVSKAALKIKVKGKGKAKK